MQHDLALLKLMYLVSPALPVGAYAYSQGQEYAIDAGWLRDERVLRDWIRNIMRHGVGNTDVPVLLRLYDAWRTNDDATINKWNDFLAATRETKELLLEDEQLGLALSRVLDTHTITDHHQKLETSASYVTLFALAGVKWEVEATQLAYGFLWAWLENQVAAATKTMPLGQTSAQRILMGLIGEIPDVVATAMALSERDIGASLPGLTLSSSLHEQQYSRLFRS